MTRCAFLLSLAIGLVTIAAPALDAQDLQAQVMVDPVAGTATYDFHFQGPPNGAAMLWVGPWLSVPPIPGPLGPLYIHPSFLLPATPLLPLDPSGQRQLQFTIPAALSAGIPFTCQSLNLDPAGTLRFSNNAVSLAQNVLSGTCLTTYSFTQDSNGDSFNLIGRGTPGAVVEVELVDDQGVRHTWTKTIGADGRFALDGVIPGGLTNEDQMRILCDGNLEDTIVLTHP